MTEMQSQRIKTWAKIANKREIQEYFRNHANYLTFAFVSGLCNLDVFKNQDKCVNQFLTIKQKDFSL